MARKQLIKGANATRVEERIARVPDEPASVAEAGIFGALKAMESAPAARASPLPAAPAPAAAAGAPKKAVAPRSPKAAAAPKAASPSPRKPENVAVEGAAPAAPAPSRPPAAPSRPPAAAPAAAPARARLGASDFSPAEREEILRCCIEYRNRLPTYLLSARKEVELLDSIIEKCGGAPDSPSRSD